MDVTGHSQVVGVMDLDELFAGDRSIGQGREAHLDALAGWLAGNRSSLGSSRADSSETRRSAIQAVSARPERLCEELHLALAAWESRGPAR